VCVTSFQSFLNFRECPTHSFFPSPSEFLRPVERPD
jgi:hypothetical protein